MSTESVNFAATKVSTRAVVASFGIFVSALFWLVVATYPSFFFFNPFAETDALRATMLTLTTIGWVLISTGTVVLFALRNGTCARSVPSADCCTGLANLAVDQSSDTFHSKR